MVEIMGKRLIAGIGINDADYRTQVMVNGKMERCPIYMRWMSMVTRCYSITAQSYRPNYAECSVCDDWLKFTKFKKWMEKQDWQGKQLDKDILFVGNKVYSPEFCVFVDLLVNSFINEREAGRGKFKIGVCFVADRNKYQSNCSNPFTRKLEFLGKFDTEIEAHLAWKKRKHELACQIADMQTDERVAQALRTRYL